MSTPIEVGIALVLVAGVRLAPGRVKARRPPGGPDPSGDGGGKSRSVEVAVAGLLTVSGAVAVVYEVLWQRQLALLLGSAAPATAAVLAAFFAGLGLGNWVLGEWSGRWRRPLRVYAALELGAAVGALLVSPILAGLEQGYPRWLAWCAGHPELRLGLKVGLSLVAVALPTFCLGGTLPVLARWIDRGAGRLGLRVGWLYATNTAGAAGGALLLPWVFLPRLGMAGTTYFAAALNVGVALAALGLDRSQPGSVRESAGEGAGQAIEGRKGGPKGLHATAGIAGAAFFSGFVVFALQVQWNRAFAQVHDNSMHAFALITTVFILALAAGAQGARWVLRRGDSALVWLRRGWGWGALGILASPRLFVAMTDGLRPVGSGVGAGGSALHLGLVAFAVLWVPIMLLGVGLPLILELAGAREDARTGRLVGRLFATNIAGCVAGALVAGFGLPRVLGLWPGMAVVGVLTLVAAGVVGQRSAARAAGHLSRRRGFEIVVVGVLAVGGLWLSAGLPRVRIATSQGERLISVREGSFGVVAVTERPGSRRLKLNNHYALGGTLSVGDQRFQAHLPMLLHPAARRVGVLGLGTGITAGGILFHPVERVEVVELVPEVVVAARESFGEAAAGLFEDSRVKLVVEDARNHLRAGAGPYDVIVGDLVVPWRQGEGALCTLEHFEAARAALAPGGLFCQWLPMFQLTETETRILLRTFLRVFPRAWVWRGDFSADRPALALVGGEASFEWDPTGVARRLAAMRPDPANPQLADPAGLWMNWVGVLENDDLDATETRVNRESWPWLEILGSAGSRGEPGSSFFVGAPLNRWLLGVRSASVRRVGEVGEAERRAGEAGDLLYEFALRLEAGDEMTARRLRADLKARLPGSVYAAVFGGNP